MSRRVTLFPLLLVAMSPAAHGTQKSADGRRCLITLYPEIGHFANGHTWYVPMRLAGIAMTGQLLNNQNVGARLQKVRRKRVSQRMARRSLR